MLNWVSQQSIYILKLSTEIGLGYLQGEFQTLLEHIINHLVHLVLILANVQHHASRCPRDKHMAVPVQLFQTTQLYLCVQLSTSGWKFQFPLMLLFLPPQTTLKYIDMTLFYGRGSLNIAGSVVGS